MDSVLNNSTDFTGNAWDALYDAVDNTYFQDQDASLIYAVLKKRLRFISFGEYLRRYIYRRAGLTEPFAEVPLAVYQQIIKDSFAENNTPRAFEATTAKMSALSRNWLTQRTVNRKVVFLLGFGLGMNLEDVNEFLTKALREQGMNAKNPFEVICWYCFKNHYSFLKYEKLWDIYCATDPNSFDLNLLYSDCTIGARDAMKTIGDDAALLAFVSKLKSPENAALVSMTAQRCFQELYERAKELIAELYNMEEAERHRIEVEQYQMQLLNNDRISDAERQQKIARKKDMLRHYSPGDITESDIEHIISSAIPADRHGNLTPVKASKLNAQFAGKRFSRQHIHDVLAGKSDVTRFDLITLNFFIYSQTLDAHPNVKERYCSFVESTNRILNRCSLGDLYISNPYECFVLMCILSDDPLGTYADVWELSYESSEKSIGVTM